VTELSSPGPDRNMMAAQSTGQETLPVVWCRGGCLLSGGLEGYYR
jgi:hypothetical protein